MLLRHLAAATALWAGVSGATASTAVVRSSLPPRIETISSQVVLKSHSFVDEFYLALAASDFTRPLTLAAGDAQLASLPVSTGGPWSPESRLIKAMPLYGHAVPLSEASPWSVTHVPLNNIAGQARLKPAIAIKMPAMLEPSGWMLLLCGVVVIGFMMQRKSSLIL